MRCREVFRFVIFFFNRRFLIGGWAGIRTWYPVIYGGMSRESVGGRDNLELRAGAGTV